MSTVSTPDPIVPASDAPADTSSAPSSPTPSSVKPVSQFRRSVYYTDNNALIVDEKDRKRFLFIALSIVYCITSTTFIKSNNWPKGVF